MRVRWKRFYNSMRLRSSAGSKSTIIQRCVKEKKVLVVLVPRDNRHHRQQPQPCSGNNPTTRGWWRSGSGRTPIPPRAPKFPIRVSRTSV